MMWLTPAIPLNLRCCDKKRSFIVLNYVRRNLFALVDLESYFTTWLLKDYQNKRMNYGSCGGLRFLRSGRISDIEGYLT